MPLERSFTIPQTIGGAFATVAGYFLVLYIGTPVIEWGLNLFGRLFVPERFGGGSEVANPGLFGSLVRVLFLSGASIWLAVVTSARLCPDAHVRTVAVILAVSVVSWVGFLFVVGFPAEISFPGIIALLTIALTAAPPLVYAYWIWQAEEWP